MGAHARHGRPSVGETDHVRRHTLRAWLALGGRLQARHAIRERRYRMSTPLPMPATEPRPLWYKDAVIYQLHVKTFSDSNGDGIGDFRGLSSKLDYLSDLGVNCVWLLPMYPSPFRDDGYDIADYYSIHPSYGTLDDFREFLDAAHARRLRVVTELVLNHTSDQHAWF